MPHPHPLELLAPARDADIGIEAINHGADAVYIGGPGFGARAGAGNTVADIERLAQHAHRFNARVFVTLNTILRDDELEPARSLTWQLHEAGVDALIIQDMGLLMLDLPPIQLHASTQTDIRTPAKARFLQDAGLSQIVLARELTLAQIAAIRDVLDPVRCNIEFFVHGALCVAYSGQCYISHAHTGRSANRGDCSQACRLPYQVKDAQGRIIAHDAHVLSMKDNNQSLNLAPLIDAGVRSFKIEGRYKDMGYVKNITAHYRRLLDDILNTRPDLTRTSDGRCTFSFTPDPEQNFNRAFTDYFVHGRQIDIGAFDSPKNPGQPIGHVTRVDADHFDLLADAPKAPSPALHLSNGDGLCYYDLQKNLIGAQTNRVQALGGGVWRIYPKDALHTLHDLRKGTIINRNRSMDWARTLEKKSAERRIGVWLRLTETDDGLQLIATDEQGHTASAHMVMAHTAPHNEADALEKLRHALARLGDTLFVAIDIGIDLPRPWFVPASQANALRRAAVAALESARAAAWQRLPRAAPIEPPTPYPDDALTYLANVFNHAARDFYARHGVKVIDAAYESHEKTDEASLMITKHCVRYALSLCPKQAKGITGVQGTVRAEPLHLINGKEKLTLRFDCKPYEMHVVGKIKPGVLQRGTREAAEHALRFYRTAPATPKMNNEVGL
ncbi:peptidase U32 family protein [Ottowia sp.]|uniref:peptidase U32 family protein n=1 Tax=Ottowia sp. TaxID=1898956 RepID=UPI003A8B590E